MKASELRLGNYLKYKKGHLCKVVSIPTNNIIDVKGLKDSYINGTYNTRDLQPIPLTAEWLLKFGFTEFYHKGLKGYISDKFELLYNLDSHQMYSYNEADGSIWNLTRCKHVHQLQNLYFALTGEGLTIKQND